MTPDEGRKPQSNRELAEMIAKFRTPPGLDWRPLADDIATVLDSRAGNSPGARDEGVKRFLLFNGERYYPGGGWNDFIGSFGTIEEARSTAGGPAYDWSHIVDLATGKVVD